MIGQALSCRRAIGTFIWACLAATLNGVLHAQPVKVAVIQNEGSWHLVRGLTRFFVKGVGGDGDRSLLRKIGGNCVRTWGVDGNTAELLDDAQRQGLTVCLGIWLGHERHGFDYNNARAVLAQRDKVREAVLKFRNHPALLMWGIGNEMEGTGAGDNPAIWYAINDIAGMVKQLDPNHPTMTTVAEIGGERVRCLHEFCQAIDVVGINSYGGIGTVAQRYRDAGGTKPYVICEFGPRGWWETKRTAWGAPLEPSSNVKAASYREAWSKAVEAEKDKLCLGGFAFLWGNKVEGTATWFGMLLPDGSKLGAADAMCEAWTGKPPKNLCPKIHALRITGPDTVDPGAGMTARLTVSDPEGDPLRVKWGLSVEATGYQTTGPNAPMLPTFPDAVRTATSDKATVVMPDSGGKYRLYAYVYDGQGGAATANVPILVRGPEKPMPCAKPTLPLVIYDEEWEKTPYTPSGWMGDTKSIEMDGACTDNPHSGKCCLKVTFQKANGWGGVAWQNPPNDWGDLPGGFDLTGAKSLTFWARGSRGGERVKFGVGLIKPDKKYFDTARLEKEFTLTNKWQRFSLDLAGVDLSRIKTGFLWVVEAQRNPASFYLDMIRFD